MTGIIGPDFFAPDYFAPDYFGGEADGNAMLAVITAGATVTATLSAAEVASADDYGAYVSAVMLARKQRKERADNDDDDALAILMMAA